MRLSPAYSYAPGERDAFPLGEAPGERMLLGCALRPPTVATMDRTTITDAATAAALEVGHPADGPWSMRVDTPKGPKRVTRDPKRRTFMIEAMEVAS